MSTRKQRQVKAQDGSLSERLEAQRQTIFKAMCIIEACRLGNDSMLAPLNGGEEPELGDALAAAHDLLDGVAAQLEALAAPTQI